MQTKINLDKEPSESFKQMCVMVTLKKYLYLLLCEKQILRSENKSSEDESSKTRMQLIR